MRRISILALLMFAVAGSASAQAPGPVLNGSIDPGMSHDLVIARLGKPSSEHSEARKRICTIRTARKRKWE